jgi:hypothetical protein
MHVKILFALGIFAVHGALAASWADLHRARPRLSPVCSHSLPDMPDFRPQGMLLAFVVRPVPMSHGLLAP